MVSHNQHLSFPYAPFTDGSSNGSTLSFRAVDLYFYDVPTRNLKYFSCSKSYESPKVTDNNMINCKNITLVTVHFLSHT
jgi:hypothetical protein